MMEELLNANFITLAGIDYIRVNPSRFADILQSKDVSCAIRDQLIKELSDTNTRTDVQYVDILMLAAAYAGVNDCNLNNFLHFSPKSIK